jgi:integrase
MAAHRLPGGFPDVGGRKGWRTSIMRLTDKTVAALTLSAGKTDVIHFDVDMRGFGYRLRAGATGRVLSSWIVQYKRGGRSRRITIGPATVLGAERARAAAREVLAKVALGQDPAGDRAGRRGRDAVTMRSTVDDYLAAAAARVRARWHGEMKRYLTGPHFRQLHGFPLDQIDRRAVAARLVALEREHGAATAAKCRAALSGYFVWAMRSGVADANPAGETPRPATGRPRERILTDDEIAAVWRAAGEDDHGKIVRLLILIAARRTEVGGMTWDELDFDAGTWTLPSLRSKNHRAHVLPIMPAMRAILETIPRRATRDHLFGEHAATGFNGWDGGKRALDRRAGVAGWTLHDLRRTAATRMGDIGIAPHIVEEILNHQSGHRRGPAGAYLRSRYEREVRVALATWHDKLRTIAAGGARNVLPFGGPH